jgi:hypothetical protein
MSYAVTIPENLTQLLFQKELFSTALFLSLPLRGELKKHYSNFIGYFSMMTTR